MSKKTERIGKLIEILQLRSYVSIKELASLLGVSEMTVRRDLRLLENNQMAENVDGTAVFNQTHTVSKTADEYNLLAEQDKQDNQKDRIGRCAAGLVMGNDIIILDTGTTTERIVPYLPSNKKITAICYNLNVLTQLRRKVGIDIVLAGGYFHMGTQLFESPEGISFLRRQRAQKVFVSAAGIHSELGITCANGYEVPIKEAILHSALQKILVADSSKFGLIRQAHFCDLANIDAVVTDDGLSWEWRERLGEMDTTLYLAK